MNMALTSLYIRRRQSLIGTIARIVADRQVAEDLAQESYIKTSRAIDQTTIDHLETYLFRTARNLALDHLRRRAVRAHLEIVGVDDPSLQPADPDGVSNEERIARRQELALLVRTLAGLPQRVQDVVVLARIEKRTNRSIAQQLGISERTVFNDLKMAMAHCRDALAGHDGR